MRRIKLVLALAAVMVAMLVAFSAPALANNDRNDRNDRWEDNKRWDKDWDWERNWERNWDRDWDHDWWDNGPFVSDFHDDCEWEWEEEGGFWVLGPWGWYWQPWGFWELDC
jgi:hypothetical protein